jgi:hypothetical protein
MKCIFGIITTILLLASACSKDNFKTELDGSRDAWQSFKSLNNNTYYYTVSESSWVGFSSKTKIFVSNGVVSKRSYESFSTHGGTGQITALESWSEDKANLNQHQKGAKTWTLDEVYDKAKNEWLKVDKKENEIYFEVQNSGMISLCGYTPKNCADDCLVGISILEIKPWDGK